MEDLVPPEDEIEWLVKRIRNHCSGGPSGIQNGHLKGWLDEARKAEASAEKVSATEGTTAVLRGTEGGETE